VYLRKVAVCARSAALREPACHVGSHRATCHPAEAASPALTPAVVIASTRFIHQLRMKGCVDLSDAGKRFAQSRYRSAGHTRCQLVKPAFCPTRHSRCEQLAHSCYTVTGFSRIWDSINGLVCLLNTLSTRPPMLLCLVLIAQAVFF